MRQLFADKMGKPSLLFTIVGCSLIAVYAIKTGVEAHRCQLKNDAWEENVSAHEKEIKWQSELRARKAALIATESYYGCNKSLAASYQEIMTQCSDSIGYNMEDQEVFIFLGAVRRVEQLGLELALLRKNKPVFVNGSCSV
jgi:hypothetical protein